MSKRIELSQDEMYQVIKSVFGTTEPGSYRAGHPHLAVQQILDAINDVVAERGPRATVRKWVGKR